MNFRGWSRTLGVRAALGYFLLVFSATLLFSALFYYLWRGNLERIEQAVHWDIAGELARELELDEKNKETLNKIAVLESFYYLQAINPRFDPFLLDSSGKVLVSFFADYQLKEEVDLAPITAFLQSEGLQDDTILGTHPARRVEEQVAFSVAPVKLGDFSGYVYLTTGSERYSAIFRYFYDVSAILGTLGLFAVILLVSFGLAALLYLNLSRNLRAMLKALHSYSEGDFSKRIPVRSGDELGEVAETINSMAQQIERSTAEKQKLDAMRRELIANVSHDLRHPVAVMHTALESSLIRFDSLDTEEVKESLQRALGSCAQLKRRLEELFALTKYQSAEFQLSLEVFEVSELLDEVLFSLGAAAENKSITLTSEYENDLSLVEADIELYRRVFTNLIQNAFQHCEAGDTVQIKIRRGDLKGFLTVDIVDSGAGIAASELPKVFERYYSKRQDAGGSGLGLAIAKRIVELHGATIRVESQEGVETMFTFQIPLKDNTT